MKLPLTIIVMLLLLQNCNQHSDPTSSINIVSTSELSFEKNEKGTAIAYHNDSPFSGKAISKYKNGQSFTEKNYQKGIQEGAWLIYYENGNRMKSGVVKNGQKEGNSYEWYESGQKKYEQPYHNNQKHGKWLSWYTNGVKWTERDFENDVLNGKVLVWDSLGTLTKEYTYQKGEMVDKQFYFENTNE